MWKEGKIDELLSEGDEIQRRIQSTKRKEEDSKKGFTRLMMFRKVRQALKLIDANSEVNGVHVLTDDIRQTLKEKHPTGAPENPEILIDGDMPRVEEVIFEEIHGSTVQATTKNTSGTDGPTKVDSDIWKHILCSKVSGKVGKALADEIVFLGRKICTKDIPNGYISTGLKLTALFH